jgi:hypothetical protein
MTADGDAAAMMMDARLTPAPGRADEEEKPSDGAWAALRLSRLLNGEESNRPERECGAGCVAVMVGMAAADQPREKAADVTVGGGTSVCDDAAGHMT